MSSDEHKADGFSISSASADKYAIFNSFDDFDLQDDLLRGIYAYGFERPLATQRHCLRPILAGRDTIVKAPSGDGKTSTFIIAALQRIDCSKCECQVLVLVPKRDSALRIGKMAAAIGEHLQINCLALVGDNRGRSHIDRLRVGQHCVIGTPEQVLRMVNKGHLRLGSLKMLVIDEVEDILSQGFGEHIKDIFKTLPAHVQVCAISGHTASDILALSTDSERDVVQLAMRHELALKGVHHHSIVGLEQGEVNLDVFCDLYYHEGVLGVYFSWCADLHRFAPWSYWRGARLATSKSWP